jgi:AraC-like DNA-binding protein
MQYLTQNAAFESLFRYTAGFGVSREAICDAAGIDVAAATVGSGLVPATAMFDAVEFAAQATGHRDFGLLMAERLDARIIGLPALIAERCGSIHDYYGLMQQHMGHHTTGYTLSLDEDATGGVGRLRVFAQGRFRPAQFAEAVLAIHARAIRQFLGASWRPGKVLLAHRQLGTAADYRRAFGTTVVFEAGQNAITFTPEDLQWRAPGHAATEHGFERIETPDHVDIVDRTTAIIRAFLPAGDASLKAVAAALSVTPRTLQRELARAGSSYSLLLTEIRAILARDYLARSGVRASEVAGLLGFSDATALSRFVRQAMGTSPRDLIRNSRRRLG